MGFGEGVTGLVVTVITVSCEPEPQPAANSATAATMGRRSFTSSRFLNSARSPPGHPYPLGVSVIALVMLVAAIILLAVAEWPRLSRRVGLQERARARKRSHLRVVESPDDDSDEFAKAVERDLANLPTFDPRAKRD